ncbi:MAG: 5'/3'-nucleotidase SurE [Helicobacter sp.]|nr:5'/3'-nucleotidase SurE [Helicobacter sp.]
MKTILVTNDDGYESKGLLELCDSLRAFGRVICIAPANEKSACGHGLSITSPLRVYEVAKDFYKVDDGAPTDCIYLAMNLFFKDKKPDLVVSGINLGTNMGEDITYSGTVAGAMEGAIYNIPAIAISQRIIKRDKANVDFTLSKHVISDLVSRIFKDKYPLNGRKLLNVNVPNIQPKDWKGYKITQMSYRLYDPKIATNVDPRDLVYHWIGQQASGFEDRDKFELGRISGVCNDFAALKDGYVSITPLMVNTTSYEDINGIKEWLI